MENFVEKELSLYLASYLSENYDSQIAATLAAGAANSELTSNTGPVEAFPGYLDRGTPLIIEEGGRQTVIGLFKGAEIHRDRPSLFYKIDPDALIGLLRRLTRYMTAAVNPSHPAPVEFLGNKKKSNA